MTTTFICTECAAILPVDDHESPDAPLLVEFPSINCELKNSTEMLKSSQDGCQGCRFFLDAITQHCNNDPGILEPFLQRGEPISLQGPSSQRFVRYRLATDYRNPPRGTRHGGTRFIPIFLDLRLAPGI